MNVWPSSCFEQLGELQESFLAKHARAAAAKLLAGQEEAFCKACKALLDQEIAHGGHSRQDRIVDDLLKATINRRRIRINYCKPGSQLKITRSSPIRFSLSTGSFTWTGTA
jgi:predicted DNA-binding transcriptional regulator YafY